MAINPFAIIASAGAGISGVSSVLNQLTGLDNAKWNIQQAAYGHDDDSMIKFHVFQGGANYSAAVEMVTDNVNRRVVPFEFPYIDGQTTEDLGRGGGSYDFNIILFGPNYYAAYVALVKAFNDARPGILIHPVLGRTTAKFKTAQVIHQSEKRQAVVIHATFLEHNFDLSFAKPKSTTKSLLADAVSFIGSLARVYNSIQSNLAAVSIIRNAILSALANYQADYQSTLVAMNTTFNSGTSADIPGLLPPNTAQGTSFSSAESPNDPFAGLTPSQIQSQQSQALAAIQAEDVVIAIRDQATALIKQMEAATVDGTPGFGALAYYDEILTIKQSQAALQSVLQIGIQSSNAQVKSYTVPILMSVREVCFANGLSPDRSYDIELLNPDLSSLNFIPAGTVVEVPT